MELDSQQGIAIQESLELGVLFEAGEKLFGDSLGRSRSVLLGLGLCGRLVLWVGFVGFMGWFVGFVAGERATGYLSAL